MRTYLQSFQSSRISIFVRSSLNLFLFLLDEVPIICHQSPIFISLTLSTSSSPSRHKQLTFSMTHSTLISTKYFTVPFFQAVNLISEGISHLAIIFWTIKPISEEQRLSAELYRPNYVRPFVLMSNTLFKWAIVVRAVVIHWHIIFGSF